MDQRVVWLRKEQGTGSVDCILPFFPSHVCLPQWCGPGWKKTEGHSQVKGAEVDAILSLNHKVISCLKYFKSLESGLSESTLHISNSFCPKLQCNILKMWNCSYHTPAQNCSMTSHCSWRTKPWGHSRIQSDVTFIPVKAVILKMGRTGQEVSTDWSRTLICWSSQTKKPPGRRLAIGTHVGCTC